MKKKLLWLLLPMTLFVLSAIGGATYYFHDLRKSDIVAEEGWIYIDKNSTYADVMTQLRPLVEERKWNRLERACKMEQTDVRIEQNKTIGAYHIKEGMTAIGIARTIKLGSQTPIRLTFNNIRTRGELCKRLSQSLMADSAEIQKVLTDEVFCRDIAGTNPENVISIFLPDTYEVYWTITPEQLVKRMKKEFDAFWTDERQQKAKKLQITPHEASIIASIAEEETLSRAERGIVARLYWNRLQRNMLLQADPTVKYAIGDFSLTRILRKHLTVDSPYNTYKYVGLPPGPIRIAEKATIDALLNSSPHSYIYMCAKEDFSGTHNFTNKFSEHNRNAKRYRQALDKRLKEKK